MLNGTTAKLGTELVTGTVNVSGGSWNNSADLIVGSSSIGTLTLDGGYVSNSSGYLGLNPNASGSATVTRGTWSNSGDLGVGKYGTGSLHINGGYVSSKNAFIRLDIFSDPIGK